MVLESGEKHRDVRHNGQEIEHTKAETISKVEALKFDVRRRERLWVHARGKNNIRNTVDKRGA
jgi:hypothetical protein